MPPKSRPNRASSQQTQSRGAERDSESSSLDDDDEPQPGTSQTTQSQSGRGKGPRGSQKDRPGRVGSQDPIDEAQLERLVSDLVTYLLISAHNKFAINRTDISKHVLKEYSRQFNVVFERAQVKLRQVFGIEVKELASKKGRYILVNALRNLGKNVHLTWKKAENCQFGLLTVILTMIYMNGNILLESELWPALSKLAITKNIEHEDFGNVQKLITKDFVRQLYLECKRVPDVDPPDSEFTWGERAKAEVCKMELLEFACKIYGNKPQDWASQFADAKAELGK